MSEIKTNKISPRKGTTTTIGDSGDTISLPSGTSLNIQGTYSGINSISWDTTAKTANFTAETNRGYFINTTSGEVTITLPATPVAGSFIGIKDYALTAQTNNILIAPNGNKIQGTTDTYRISTQGGAVNLVYVDATQGWLTYDAAQASDVAQVALFTTATGGTVTTCGDFKIHTFTSPGTFCVSQVGNSPTNPLGGPSNVDYLVVAGGGSGGTCQSSSSSGGGGAGGYRTTFPSPGCNAGSFPITATAFPITVGAGGAASPTSSTSGSNSIFSSITSAGGGHGSGSVSNASAGGSGGGGQGGFNSGPGGPYPTAICGAAGNTPPVSPPQGNLGGSGRAGTCYRGAGGGGGAGAAAVQAPPNAGGAGGVGLPNSITGSATYYAGGGGGSIYSPGPAPGGAGGAGGGGAGGPGGGPSAPTSPGTAGTANTGGGGGGSPANDAGPNIRVGASGGSGIVIIRYKYQ